MTGFLDFTPLIARPEVAYLYPELDPSSTAKSSSLLSSRSRSSSDIFVFQYWPSQIQDSYEAEWVTKQIPGGSHPLYQWVSGSGRTISFEAIFTSEVDEDSSVTAQNFGTTAIGAALIPSARYTVNVAAAINTLQSFQYPTYRTGGKKSVTEPPPRLRLVLPGTRIGRADGYDDILCFLKSAKITHESAFPSGRPRVATVALEFIETVQNVSAGNGLPQVKFIGRDSFMDLNQYTYRGTLTAAS